jgi:hypothetical protein
MLENQSSVGGPHPEAANDAAPAPASGTPETIIHSPIPASPPPSTAKSAAAWCARHASQLAQHLWTFIGDVGRYYWGIRGALWEYLAGHAPNLTSESIRMREVRLAPYESHALAEFDDSDGWKVSVPGRCVVCGEQSSNPPGDEELSIDDAARAFWVPVGAAIVGASLGLFLWDRRILLLAIVLGPVLGYALRGKVAVRMRVVRCDLHGTRTGIPQVLAWGNTLVLRFGHKLLRKLFLYGEPMGAAASQAPAATAGPAAPGSSSPNTAADERPLPATIPLADSPAPEDATITHDRPPEFEPDKDSSSPLVP